MNHVQKELLERIARHPNAKFNVASAADSGEPTIGFLVDTVLSIEGDSERSPVTAETRADVTWPAWMGKHPRVGTPWTPTEEAILKGAWERGVALKVIAHEHGRALGGILSRLSQAYGDRMFEVRPAHPDDVQSEVRGILNRAFPNSRYRGAR